MRAGDVVRLKVEQKRTNELVIPAGTRGIIYTTISEGRPSETNATDCVILLKYEQWNIYLKAPLKDIELFEDSGIRSLLEPVIAAEKQKQFYNDLFCVICFSSFSEAQPICTKCGNPAVRDPYAAEQYRDLQVKDARGCQLKLETLIAHGKDASVFRTHRESSDETLAIKISRMTCASPVAARDNLIQEGKLLQRLEHPSVVKLLESGTCGDTRHYLLMEYLAAKNLQQKIEDITYSQTIKTAIAVSLALEALHEQGIVHPLMKAADIIVLDQAPYAKLVDFSPVKIESHPNGTYSVNGVAGAADASMAPEYFVAKEILPESNIYSLAAIVFQCLTGKQLFGGKSFKLIGQILNDAPPSLSETRPDLSFDPVLESTLEACLEKSPKNRPSASRLKTLFSWVEVDQLCP